MTKDVQIAVRVEAETVALADEVASLFAKTSPFRPSRTAVLRAAIERGLADMKAELTGKGRKRGRNG